MKQRILTILLLALPLFALSRQHHRHIRHRPPAINRQNSINFTLDSALKRAHAKIDSLLSHENVLVERIKGTDEKYQLAISTMQWALIILLSVISISVGAFAFRINQRVRSIARDELDGIKNEYEEKFDRIVNDGMKVVKELETIFTVATRP